MSLRTEIQRELALLGKKPQKSLGQNFLVEEKTYQDITAAAEIQPNEKILEIGPGLGTLTQCLVGAGADVIALDKDEELFQFLQQKFANERHVILKAGDILTYPIKDLSLQDGAYKIVANIPYYITSHLLRIIFEQWPRPKKIILMMQKEVADRIVVRSGRWSLLAVSVAYYATTKIIKKVPAGQFFPSPEVDSALIAITPTAITDSPEFTQLFFKIIHAGFAEKRKQLINNLGKHLGINRDDVLAWLGRCNIEPRRRAETLSVPEWRTLTAQFSSQS